MSLLQKIGAWISRIRVGNIESRNRHFDRLVAQAAEHGNEFRRLDVTTLQQEFVGRRKLHDPSADARVLALLREVAERTLGLRPYDVQLMSALALDGGYLIEQHTGEGKTLAAALAAALRYLRGERVHVLTYNDYLAQRDAAWMGPFYNSLGMTVGSVQHHTHPIERQQCYRCDVTYVTATEAGFDLLRDQRITAPSERVQPEFEFAIVDEADSILIDEARVPLVLAGALPDPPLDLAKISAVVSQLTPNQHFATKNQGRNVSLTAVGIEVVERQLACGELYSQANTELLSRVNLALQAEALLHRDRDYIVRQQQVELIDELTGRVAIRRRWPHGLHAAVEAKEGVPIQPQGQILSSITLYDFLRHYRQLVGMTGTASEAAEELRDFYNLSVFLVPPHQTNQRIDAIDQVFATKQAKHAALLEIISSEHQRQRPILVGTASIGESEQLADLLLRHGMSCQVLNAKNDAEEAKIVANAGRLGSITIATNMAGRGTDIRLGGETEDHRQQIVQLGGLLVLGTNRHESRRIDNQLRGRCGRQGDPGESRFIVSLEDDLLARHGAADSFALANQHHTQVSNTQESEAYSGPLIGADKKLAHLQRIMEGQCFEIRRTLRKYTICLEQHRRTVVDIRNQLIQPQHAFAWPATAKEFYQAMVEQFGIERVNEVATQVSLLVLDEQWADHLAFAGEIRDSVHLISMGGMNAIDEFNREVNAHFRDLLAHFPTSVVDILKQLSWSASGPIWETGGVVRPSTTWTYMINDMPTGSLFDQLTNGLKRWLRRNKK